MGAGKTCFARYNFFNNFSPQPVNSLSTFDSGFIRELSRDPGKKKPSPSHLHVISLLVLPELVVTSPTYLLDCQYDYQPDQDRLYAGEAIHHIDLYRVGGFTQEDHSIVPTSRNTMSTSTSSDDNDSSIRSLFSNLDLDKVFSTSVCLVRTKKHSKSFKSLLVFSSKYLSMHASVKNESSLFLQVEWAEYLGDEFTPVRQKIHAWVAN